MKHTIHIDDPAKIRFILRNIAGRQYLADAQTMLDEVNRRKRLYLGRRDRRAVSLSYLMDTTVDGVRVVSIDIEVLDHE